VIITRTLLALLTLAAALVTTPPAHATGSGAGAGVYQLPDPNQALVFEGKGWGHGVGLCQWGARGRALAGQTGEQIVAAYYTGTTVQKAVAPETTIRVLIHPELKLNPDESGRITGQGGAWLVEMAGAPSIQAPAGAALEITPDGAAPGGGRFTVKDKAGTALGAGTLRAPLVLRPQEDGTRLVVGYKPAAQVSGRAGAFYDAFRGELIVSAREEGLETVNRLSLEDYLRGVVPSEMPASWPGEALKAQTLAARSYAVWQALGRSSQRFDVDDTDAFQVYREGNAEHPAVNQVVDATAGQVITHSGRVVQAYFFSTCGGWTENNESVWQSGQPLPYLRGIRDADPTGKPYDADSTLSSWSTGALTVAQLEQALNGHEATEIGRLISLDMTKRAPSGRLLSITVTGTAGTKTLRPDALMVRFNRAKPTGVSQLFSTNFDLKLVPATSLLQSQGGAPATPTAGPPPPTRTPSEQPVVIATPTPVRSALPLSPTAVPATPTPAFRLEMTQSTTARPDGPTNQFFSETGHNVGGAFLNFYRARGGLDIFGYPRTEEILENGRTVQYFQRGAFEYHTDRAGTPYEVQLALLGDTLTTPRRPFPTTAAFGSSADHVYFPETQHGLHFGFLTYWRERGALDVFGYPISEELTENGFTVQYFQRARFEYHPELPEPYKVSLGLLGDQLLQQRLWLR